MPNRYQPRALHDGPNLCPVTIDDLDDITQIVWAGFPGDPKVNYRFPLREKYPQDYWNWTRKEYQGYIEQPKKFLVHVVEIPTDEDGEVVKRPIALAVWDIALLTKDNNTGTSLPALPDREPIVV